MDVNSLLQLVNGTLVNKNADLTRQINGGCGADLMSDVLASVQPEAVLLTGLCNPQVIRTAQMADVAAIVLVRGKIPPRETVDLAIKERIALISSPYGMFEICGRLYQAGLPSFESPMNSDVSPCEE
jgi:hypothetical protein